MVVSWLVHSVATSICQSILWMDNAVDIWKDLKARYSQGDLLRISHLQHKLTSIKQGDMNITDYFTKLRTIWDELESYRPDLVCTCASKCGCDALVEVKKRKDQDRIMEFMRGLNDQYNHVRSNIIIMDPLPLINKALSYMAQQERKFASFDALGNLSLVNAVANTRLSNSCSYYGRDNYTVEICYKKNGFSPNFFSNRGGGGRGFGRGKTGGKSTNDKVCTHCGIINHTVDECYKKHDYPPGHKFYKPQGASVNNTIKEEENVSVQRLVIMAKTLK
ncbi:hypothetical protein GmHk_14G042009 [Glycine max]|nr:hypothetical protein GmHk_14G042009 [Glycine max]